MTTLQVNPPTSSIDLADQFKALVIQARHWGLKPMAAITTLEVDGMYCGAVLILYAAETHAIEGKLKEIPLTPYFYPQGVADCLEAAGIIKTVHETKRTGILTAWCEISTSFK